MLQQASSKKASTAPPDRKGSVKAPDAAANAAAHNSTIMNIKEISSFFILLIVYCTDQFRTAVSDQSDLIAYAVIR